MSYKDPIRRKEYSKEYSKKYNQAHKEQKKEYYQSNKEEIKAYSKAYAEAHKEQIKAYRHAHKEQRKEYSKDYYQSHKDTRKEYMKEHTRADLNSLGDTKESIRRKSRRILKQMNLKIPGYEIHHCCTYTEPYKFIYCSIELHKLIHLYLKQHNIDSDSDHYEQIKHLLDENVVKYGID